VISTIFGQLPVLLYPAPGLDVSEQGRTQICTVRGEVLGQHVNAQFTLDVNTGELLIMTPGNFIGSFRMGDLLAAHMQKCLAYAVREREVEVEDGHAPQTH
jgi:hypothetical protein